MERRLKDDLINFIKRLKGIPAKSQEDFNDVVKVLERKDVNIPNNARGKQEICDFIMTLFCSNPKLMNSSNKRLVDDLSDKLELENENKPKPKSSR